MRNLINFFIFKKNELEILLVGNGNITRHHQLLAAYRAFEEEPKISAENMAGTGTVENGEVVAWTSAGYGFCTKSAKVQERILELLGL